jgi:Xaa-Pro aminopeptidase
MASLVIERDLQRIGFEDAVTPVAAWRQLTASLGADRELFPVGAGVDQLRERKTPRELELIRQAIALTDAAFELASQQLKAGQTERELALIVDESLRKLGSDGQAFDTIVASGPNAAKPHHSPGKREIQPGDPVIIDMGGRVDGYCGDLTRTIWMGQPGEQLGTMYRLVAAAQRAAISAVRAGAAARGVDRAARDVFAAASMEQHFVHGVGHALGLRIHEAPFLGASSVDTLQSGNVVTIEPGLYIPGWGGVRIEDVVAVTDVGCDNLTSAPKLLGQ